MVHKLSQLLQQKKKNNVPRQEGRTLNYTVDYGFTHLSNRKKLPKHSSLVSLGHPKYPLETLILH